MTEHVVQQVLLPIVGGEHCDALGRVAQYAHVRVHRRDVLCLSEVLLRNDFDSLSWECIIKLHHIEWILFAR